MEQDFISTQDYIQAFKRYRNQIGLIVLAVFVLSIIIALKLPAIYKSTATLGIEPQELSQDSMIAADQRFQEITRQVMSSENLRNIIDKLDLLTNEKQLLNTSELIEKFRKKIQLEIISANLVESRTDSITHPTIQFTVAFDSESPELAQQVVNELVGLYLNKNGTQAPTLESAQLSQRITGTESTLAEFSNNHLDRLPEVKQMTIQAMVKTEQKLKGYDRKIKMLTERKLILEKTAQYKTPAYAQLKAQLKPVDAELNVLITQKKDLQQNLANFQRELRAVLQVERKYHKLMQDDDNTTLASKSKPSEDGIATTHYDLKGDQISVLKPPQLTTEPFTPNRIVILLLGILLSLGSGAGYLVFKRHVVVFGVNSPNELQTILGAPPLIVIPYLDNQEDLIRKARSKAKTIWLMFGLVLIILTFAYLFNKPPGM